MKKIPPRSERLFSTWVFALAIVLAVFRVADASGPGSPAGPAIGNPAPDFSLPELNNSVSVSLGSMQGKIVLVDFWASWCPPCRKTLPELARLQAKHPNLVVMAVSIDEQKKKALGFLDPKVKWNMLMLLDGKRSVAAQYDLGGMPSAVIVDTKGILRFRHDGYTAAELANLEAEIVQLEGEKKTAAEGTGRAGREGLGGKAEAGKGKGY